MTFRYGVIVVLSSCLYNSPRKGISSLQLSKELGITQKSAWFMLQRIREVCRQGVFKLSGTIEMGIIYNNPYLTKKSLLTVLRKQQKRYY